MRALGAEVLTASSIVAKCTHPLATINPKHYTCCQVHWSDIANRLYHHCLDGSGKEWFSAEVAEGESEDELSVGAGVSGLLGGVEGGGGGVLSSESWVVACLLYPAPFHAFDQVPFQSRATPSPLVFLIFLLALFYLLCVVLCCQLPCPSYFFSLLSGHSSIICWSDNERIDYARDRRHGDERTGDKTEEVVTGDLETGGVEEL